MANLNLKEVLRRALETTKKYVDDKTSLFPREILIDIISETDTYTTTANYYGDNLHVFDKTLSEIPLKEYDEILKLILKINGATMEADLNLIGIWNSSYTYSATITNGTVSTSITFATTYLISGGSGWGGASEVDGLNVFITNTENGVETQYILGENDTIRIYKVGYENPIEKELISSVDWDCIENIHYNVQNLVDKETYALSAAEYYSLMDGYNLWTGEYPINEIYSGYEGDASIENYFNPAAPGAIYIGQNAGWKGIHFNIDKKDVNKFTCLSGRAFYCKVKTVAVFTLNSGSPYILENEFDASSLYGELFTLNTSTDRSVSGVQKIDLWILFSSDKSNGYVNHLRVSASGNVKSVLEGDMLNWETMRSYVNDVVTTITEEDINAIIADIDN